GRLVALPARPALVVAGHGAHVLVVLRPHLQVLLAGGDRLVEVAVLAIGVGQLLVRGEVALVDLLLCVADGRPARAAARALHEVAEPEASTAPDAEDDEADREAEREEDEDPF